MHTRALLAPLLCIGATLVLATAAAAAPTPVDTRIEGATETLFEGPVLTDGHDVRPASDEVAHRCDGLNNGQYDTPGPTSTAAAVDAMAVVGEDWDGQWYAGYDDYFLERWGPDRQDDTTYSYWGILVNQVYTSVGGCQLQVDDDDEVLWAYDAFDSRPRLTMYPADHAGGEAVPLDAVELDEPYEVVVEAWDAYNESVPPSSPQRSGEPYEGATVAPVETDPEKRYQRVMTGDDDAVVTDSEGRAGVEFDETGWHRIKATRKDGEGEEVTVRSNRIDVCVYEDGDAETEAVCEEPPADTQLRIPPESEEEAPPAEEEPEADGDGSGGSDDSGSGGSGDEPEPPARNTGPVRLGKPRIVSAGAARGLVGVRWRILDPGAGVRAWAISSQRLGPGRARFVPRVRGEGDRSWALLRLPAGYVHRLRLTVVDALGRSSTTPIGNALVPRDERARGLRYRGRWRPLRSRVAWRGTVRRGSPGSLVVARLPAGRPAFVLRGVSRRARVEVRAGRRRQVFAVAPGPAATRRLVLGGRRGRPGPVALRVLRGSVGLDGVAVTP